ncbi:MAG TPA: hypothetical protein VF596_09615 [Pyrinomonadaceae bacterium]|jgi:hypothetical protein
MVLEEIDILIDGANVESPLSGVGLWTDNGNQRMIDLRAATESGRFCTKSRILQFYNYFVFSGLRETSSQ